MPYVLQNGPGNWPDADKLMANFNDLDQRNISVKSFGAVGNGSTDDTSAIQNAINSLSSGGILNFPSGQFNFTTLSVPNYVTLQGQGSEVTNLRCTGSSGIAVELGNDSTRVIVRGIKFSHSNSANTLTCIHARTIREFDIEQYAFEFFKFGIQFEEPVNCGIGRGRFTGLNNTTGTAITVGSTSGGYSATATDVRDAYISGFNVGVSVEQGSSNRIRGIFENCTNPILANASANARTMVYNTHFESNVGGAILLKATGSAEIFACGVNAYEGAYVTDWGPKISGNVSVLTHDQLLLSSTTKIQLGTTLSTSAGSVAIPNTSSYASANAAGNAVLNLLSLDSSNQTMLEANSNPLRVSNAATQTTIGANGAASALTANPVGYLKITIGGINRIIPYYNQ